MVENRKKRLNFPKFPKFPNEGGRREGGRRDGGAMKGLGTDHVSSGPLRGLEKTASDGMTTHDNNNTRTS